MDHKRKWASPQAIIIITIILLIFAYITVDITQIKPEIRNDMDSLKNEYVELSNFLDVKIPEIDSTLIIQAGQISNQGEEINTLSEEVKKLGSEE